MAIFFTNSTIGYCVGGFYSEKSPIILHQGTILKTTDGGTTWTEQSNGVALGLLSVYFVDETNGYAVREGGEIYKTINGGADWTSTNVGFTLEPVSHLNSIFFIGEIGYIVGSGSKIYKTKNGGVDWKEQVSETTNNLNSVYFTDIDTGYIVGGTYGISGVLSATILKTSDGGVTWEAQASGTNYPLSSVCFTDVNTGYAVGSNGTIIKTTTGGINSIADITADINIFSPNPVHNILTLDLKNLVTATQNILISIYNLKGDLVLCKRSGINDKVSLNVSQLTTGTYILGVVDMENIKYEGRFIKE